VLFDYIKDIFVTKQIKADLQDYNVYLINRWLSFASPPVALLVNTYCNKQYYADKKQHLILVIGVLPKLRQAPFIKYVKKKKEQESVKSDEAERVSLLSVSMELSKREIQLMFDADKVK
jgi:hypothetical protein